MAVHSLEINVWSDRNIQDIIDEVDKLLQNGNFDQIEVVDGFTYDDLDE